MSQCKDRPRTRSPQSGMGLLKGGVQFKGAEGKVDPGLLTFKPRHIPGHPDVSPEAALATPTCV